MMSRKIKRSIRKSQKNTIRESRGTIAPTSAPPLLMHWSFGVTPGARYVLAEKIAPGFLIIENQGPGKIMVDTNYEPALLAPGDVRIIWVFDRIFVDCADELFSSLEFEFISARK